MAFFHSTDVRLTPPEERAEIARVTSSVFYGYPPELIAEWCLVELDTARRWKRFEATPSRQAMRLFELHRDRKILGAEWRGWIVKGDLLCDPENHETTQGQLRAYFHVYQLMHQLMRENPEAQAAFAAIMQEVG